MASKPVERNVFIVDDEPAICELLAESLEREGFTTEVFHNAADVKSRMVHSEPDLMLLDLNLPDANGIDLARDLRKTYDGGLIMITGRSDTVDKIIGLEVGADDYIAKPFERREVVARARSLIRRLTREPRTDGSRVAKFDDLRFDLEAHELRDGDGKVIPLSTHEYSLLALLVTHAGEALSRDQILGHVADRNWHPFDRSVDVLVSRLRRKIDRQNGQRLVRSVRGVGYQFVARVSWNGES